MKQKITIPVTKLSFYDEDLKEVLTITHTGKLNQKTAKEQVPKNSYYIKHETSKVSYLIDSSLLHKFLADKGEKIDLEISLTELEGDK